MSYLVPSEFVTKMVDAGESKVFMSTRDTVIRAYMAGAILALAAAFAACLATGLLAIALRGLPAATPALRFFTGVFFGRRLRRGRVLNAMIPPILAGPTMAWRGGVSHAEPRFIPNRMLATCANR